MEFTLQNYLGAALFVAQQENSTIITKDIFDKVRSFFGGKEPNGAWVWQRDNRIARKQYKLPDVEPVDVSILSSEVEVEETDVKNIIFQIYTALDLTDHRILFLDNTRHNVDKDNLRIALDRLLNLKPAERLLAQSFCLESLNNLMTFADNRHYE
jgi:hypothetical protein